MNQSAPTIHAVQAKPQPVNLFYDSEFTGLHQSTTLISVGFVSETGAEFYAEFSDYDQSQCDEWIKRNVLAHTRWLQQTAQQPFALQEGNLSLCYGDQAFVTERLTQWLSQFPAIHVWADCLAWDWVLFSELFGGALHIPQHIFYMPFDLATLFNASGLDPATPRVEFAEMSACGVHQHNALWDAKVVKACHSKLLNMARK